MMCASWCLVATNTRCCTGPGPSPSPLRVVAKTRIVSGSSPLRTRWATSELLERLHDGRAGASAPVTCSWNFSPSRRPSGKSPAGPSAVFGARRPSRTAPSRQSPRTKSSSAAHRPRTEASPPVLGVDAVERMDEFLCPRATGVVVRVSASRFPKRRRSATTFFSPCGSRLVSRSPPPAWGRIWRRDIPRRGEPEPRPTGQCSSLGVNFEPRRSPGAVRPRGSPRRRGAAAPGSAEGTGNEALRGMGAFGSRVAGTRRGEHRHDARRTVRARFRKATAGRREVDSPAMRYRRANSGS